MALACCPLAVLLETEWRALDVATDTGRDLNWMGRCCRTVEGRVGGVMSVGAAGASAASGVP